MLLVTNTLAGLQSVLSRLSPKGHPYITIARVFTAYSALLVPTTCISPSPRLLILDITPSLRFLGNPTTVPQWVDTCSRGETVLPWERHGVTPFLICVFGWV